MTKLLDLKILIKNILEGELKLLKKYGVDHLGYRYILPDGRSFGCPTGDNWDDIEKTEEFYQSMKEYLSPELIKLYNNKHSYVTRSVEHNNNKYLDWLIKLKLDNSIGIYKFNANRIDSFFFILERGDGEKKDYLLNNIKWLEGHVNNLSKKMDNLQLKMVGLTESEIVIDKDVCSKIFFSKTSYVSYKNIIFNGNNISLTLREIEVLSNLSKVGNIKNTALLLGISDKAVEKHISRLKKKFGVNSKNELINITNKPQIQILIKSY